MAPKNVNNQCLFKRKVYDIDNYIDTMAKEAGCIAHRTDRKRKCVMHGVATEKVTFATAALRSCASWTIVYAVFLSTIVSSNAFSGEISPRVTSSTPLFGLTGDTVMPDDKLFAQVPLDTTLKTACSPEDPGVEWRGVLVRAPSRVILSKKLLEYSEFIIPLCGLYLVNAMDTVQHPGPRILVMIDDTSGKTYKGALVKADPHPTIPAPKWRPPNPSTKLAFGNYFNVNAAAYVALPIQPARYRVRVEYAGYHSNEVIIVVVDRP